jgi:hypothetical protein
MESCTFAPGLTFCPPDNKLTDVYLQRELAGHPVAGTLDFVHHVDIYSADPEHLVEKRAPAPGTGKGDKPPVWYFVSPVRSAGGRKTAGGRKARAVVGGTWHGENKKAVKGSTIGGSIRTFTYVKKSASGEGREHLGWIMKEYDIPAPNGGGNRVLCKIYRTPRKNLKASSSTTASYDSGDSKRKADGDHPDAPTPSARRTDNFADNLEHVYTEGSGESGHYDAAAYYYGTTTHLPGGQTMEFPPCAQDSFLPSSGFYGTTNMQEGDIDLDELLKLAADADYQPSEEEIQAMMRELSS